jgi:hypothetical protein
MNNSAQSPSNDPKPRYLYTAGVFRTTYHVNVAAKFLIFFRAAAKTQTDTFIRGDLIGGTAPRTWVQKANDALLFLCNESLKEWEELNPRTIESNDYWMRFRMSVKFRAVIEPHLGLWIIFKSPIFANAIREGKVNTELNIKPAIGSLTTEQLEAEIAKDNTAIISPVAEKKEAVSNTNKSDWEEKVIAYIQNGTDKMLVINNLSLTPAQIVWVHDRVGDLAIDKVVRTDTIRLMRG